MGEANARWIDSPAFHWRPDRPYCADPQFVGTSPFINRCAESFVPAEVAPSDLPLRLAIGGLQGIGLMLLAWAGSRSPLTLAETAMLLFAPLLLLAGWGRMSQRLLLCWTAFATILLAGFGAYQYWRAPGAPAAIVMAAMALFIGQTLIMAGSQTQTTFPGYSACHDNAWRLGIQVALCALCAGFVAMIAAWMGPHGHFPPMAIPLVTLAVAWMSWFLSPEILHRLMERLQASLRIALPLLVLLAAGIMGMALLPNWRPPLLLDIAMACGLLLCVNASYGIGESRPDWRRKAEFAAAITMAPLVLLGAWALAVRVAEQGWTSPRIFAGACMGVLTAYAASYIGAAFFSLKGGAWMRQIERANLAIALGMLLAIAALASPLADPARLSAQSQAGRVVMSGLRD